MADFAVDAHRTSGRWRAVLLAVVGAAIVGGLVAAGAAIWQGVATRTSSPPFPTVPSVQTPHPPAATRRPPTRRPTPAPSDDPAADYQAALSLMASKGYDLLPQHAWGEGDTLHVLIGQLRGTADHPPEQAFFFVGSRFIGTDTLRPSGIITLAAHTDVDVTLAYSLYGPSDSPCCPSMGDARVRFHWDGTKLTALDPIPSDDWSATPHR